jgi:Coenzyme F390 synthetase
MIITLEQGLYELCRQRIEEDAVFSENDHMHFNIGDMTEDIFRRYRRYELRKMIRNVYDNSSFYRRMFERAGVRADEISDFKDLQKLPFTWPSDIASAPYAFLCTSQRYVEKPVVFYSSGTTGKKKKIFYSFEDIRRIRKYIGCAMNSIADSEDTRVLSLMVNSIGRGASSVYCQSIRLVGMEGFPANMEESPEKNVQLSLQHKCNVWFGDVMTIYRIAKITEQKMDLRELGIKLIYITMGNIPDTVRKYFEKNFGCKVMTHYGFTEAGWGFAVDQDGCAGYQYNELDVYCEIVDPTSDRICECGEDGELAVTLIGREAMPLIRYRTGDITAMLPHPGSDRTVLKHIVRRLEGVYEVPEGGQIYPAMLEGILYRFPETIDYRAYIRNGRLEIEVESLSGSSELSMQIKKALTENQVIRRMEQLPVVYLLPECSLQKYCFEKKVIHIL